MAQKDLSDKDNPEYILIRNLAGLLNETGLSEICLLYTSPSPRD